MNAIIAGRSGKRGDPPGTPVFVGERHLESPCISFIQYDSDRIVEMRDVDVSQCKQLHTEAGVTWINVDGLHDVALVSSLAEDFELHPLIVEDILNTTQRPKCDGYDDHFHITLKMLRWDSAEQRIDVEQVSLVLGKGLVLSFQEKPGDVFELIRERIRKGKGRIRNMGADYLAYCLIDAIVDEYFAILEQMGEQIECVEGTLAESANAATLHRIHQLKRENLLLRRSVWPVREMINTLGQSESTLLTEDVRPYWRDAYGHSIQVIDTMETLRDLLAGMLDTYLSSVNNRMNEVMKVLTVIATIFIPLSFIAGVYGMNFQHMPELKWQWGYAAVLLLMAVVASGMLLYFKRRKWF
jgi:magnesium transporter